MQPNPAATEREVSVPALARNPKRNPHIEALKKHRRYQCLTDIRRIRADPVSRALGTVPRDDSNLREPVRLQQRVVFGARPDPFNFPQVARMA